MRPNVVSSWPQKIYLVSAINDLCERSGSVPAHFLIVDNHEICSWARMMGLFGWKTDG